MSNKALFVISYTLTLLLLLIGVTKSHEIIFKINKLC